MARQPSKKQQQQGMEFLAALIGTTTDEIAEKVKDTPVQQHEISMLQAEGVLVHLFNKTEAMLQKKCKQCSEVFATRYRAVAYCSNSCRRKAMEAIGIRWNPMNDAYQNMGVERPIVLSPQVYQVVLAAAQRIVENHNILIQEPEVPQEIPSPLEGVDIPDFLLPALNEVSQLDDQYQDEVQTTPEISLPELDFPSLPDLDSPFHS